MSDLNYRLEEAVEQLIRYGGEPVDPKLVEAVEALADLNDDLANDRSHACLEAAADRVKGLLDAIVDGKTLL